MADQHHRHKRGHRHRAHSRTSHWLVVPKPGWPQANRTGLSMKFLESDKYGNQFFTFEHSASYQTVQKRFFHAVDSYNPEFIIVSIYTVMLEKGARYGLDRLGLDGCSGPILSRSRVPKNHSPYLKIVENCIQITEFIAITPKKLLISAKTNIG